MVHQTKYYTQRDLTLYYLGACFLHALNIILTPNHYKNLGWNGADYVFQPAWLNLLYPIVISVIVAFWQRLRRGRFFPKGPLETLKTGTKVWFYLGIASLVIIVGAKLILNILDIEYNLLT